MFDTLTYETFEQTEKDTYSHRHFLAYGWKDVAVRHWNDLGYNMMCAYVEMATIIIIIIIYCISSQWINSNNQANYLCTIRIKVSQTPWVFAFFV